MDVICDVETDAYGNRATKIQCIVCIDIDTGEEHVFRYPLAGFKDFARNVHNWVGHNFLCFDLPKLSEFADVEIRQSSVVDTLVVSRLLNPDRPGGHSLGQWGEVLGVKKEFADVTEEFFGILSDDLVNRCISDCRINLKLYQRFKPYLASPRWQEALRTEHGIAVVCQEIHDNGFYFHIDKCSTLRHTILNELEDLNNELQAAFPPRCYDLGLIEPRRTAHGTLHRGDFRWHLDGDLSAFSGGPFHRIEYRPFNPGSPAQIVSRLNEAGWRPTDKTKGHLEAERQARRRRMSQAERLEATTRLQAFAKIGWKVSEDNLKTLPSTAPAAAHNLVRYLLLKNRASVLKEWQDAYNEKDHRIHGSLIPIGAWTERMSHHSPNMANIPRDDAVYGPEMREMWGRAPDTWLVGVDAESIQLRVLAHYIDDKRFTSAIVDGKKEDGTDPHSLNRIALELPHLTRNHAKTFIYAWLLGARLGKVAEILECSASEAKYADEAFVDFYPGLKKLKLEDIPNDAARGYFIGFDGRYIPIWGADLGVRTHLALAGYLQGGESIIMKKANLIWRLELKERGLWQYVKQVNFVHDEWQTEVSGSYDIALEVAKVQANSIRIAGTLYNLRCPMAGSIMNQHGRIAIGSNWSETH